MALLLYRLLFPLAFLSALPFYALRLMRRERGRAAQQKPEGYRLGLGERFGFYHRALRERLLPVETTYRLIHGEGDFLPGLVVDRYGELTKHAVFYLDPHVCMRCRYRSTELLWQCPHCHDWNTFVEERIAPAQDPAEVEA